MDQCLGLLLDRLGQMRMAVAEQIDRDPAGEIEIFLAAFAIEIDPLAAHRADIATRIDGHERRDGHGMWILWKRVERQMATPRSPHRRYTVAASARQKERGGTLASPAPPSRHRGQQTRRLSRGGTAVVFVTVVAAVAVTVVAVDVAVAVLVAILALAVATVAVTRLVPNMLFETRDANARGCDARTRSGRYSRLTDLALEPIGFATRRSASRSDRMLRRSSRLICRSMLFSRTCSERTPP